MKMRTLDRKMTPLKRTPMGTLKTTSVTERMRGQALMERNHRVLTANPLCVHCMRKGIFQAAHEVDHIIPLHRGGVDDESNLQGLCSECHKVKTAEEAGARAMGAR